jgi:parallel beta-helix repeat protein
LYLGAISLREFKGRRNQKIQENEDAPALSCIDSATAPERESKMRKKIVIFAVIVSCITGATAFAETTTCTFAADQSTVVQTGGIAGIHITHKITGQFELTVDFETDTAWFSKVDATLSDGRDLGELFRMTTMVSTEVSGSVIKFQTSSLPGGIYGNLVLTFENGAVQLSGRFMDPYVDGFVYDVDAVATRETGGWSYNYLDDFSTDKAEDDSYIHSVFWPAEAFPPPEPYLYYYGDEDNQGLVFMDYLGQPAHLGYCFPVGQDGALREVKGSLKIDVLFPLNAQVSQSPPGYLLYSLSADGQDWSVPESLGSGHHNIAIESLEGTCYVIFFGTRVIIDNLKVHLHSPPATIYVPGDFGTIQEAIDAAADGDVIEVAPGEYTGNGNRDIEFRGKAITVRSADGPEQTILDCTGPTDVAGQKHRGFYFHENEQSNSVLRGFTIQSGRIPGHEIPSDNANWKMKASHPIGAGIYCEYSSPTIINCVVKDCGAELGAGIGCVGGEPVIVDCVIEYCTAGGFGNSRSGGRGAGIGLIRGCKAQISNCILRENSGYYNSYGGGIYCRRSSATIKNCDISFNSARGNITGGGVYCAGPSAELILQNCVISNNAAQAGGGIFTERGSGSSGSGNAEPLSCYVRITNCTVAHNSLQEPQMPPDPAGGIHSSNSDLKVKNSIVWYNDGAQIFYTPPNPQIPENSPVLYSDVQDGYYGQGNIDADPLFASTDAPDYHLQSVYGRFNPASGTWVIDEHHSPCIDAGDPEDPVGHEPFPNGKRINMGVYGGTRRASKGIAHRVYHIDGINGDDTNNGLSKKNAFATIQKGVNSTRDGDIVLVWPAVYEEEVNFDGKAIRLQSAADAAVVTAARGYAFSFFKGEGAGTVLRNFVIKNSEHGIFCNGASPTISNLTIVNNEFGIAAYGGGNPKITNCILWNNTEGDLFQCEATYTCFGDVLTSMWGPTNIREDPLFADADGGDYHLRSEHGRYWPDHNVWVLDRVTSPCIDAGDPRLYPKAERMPHGGRLNMGAYGGTPYAGMSEWPLRGDVNQDGSVNMKDFAMLAEDWLASLPWAPLKLRNVDIIMPVDGTVIPVPEIRLQLEGSAMMSGQANQYRR